MPHDNKRHPTKGSSRGDQTSKKGKTTTTFIVIRSKVKSSQETLTYQHMWWRGAAAPASAASELQQQQQDPPKKNESGSIPANGTRAAPPPHPPSNVAATAATSTAAGAGVGVGGVGGGLRGYIATWRAGGTAAAAGGDTAPVGGGAATPGTNTANVAKKKPIVKKKVKQGDQEGGGGDVQQQQQQPPPKLPPNQYSLELRMKRRQAAKITEKNIQWFHNDLLQKRKEELRLSAKELRALQLLTKRKQRQQDAQQQGGQASSSSIQHDHSTTTTATTNSNESAAALFLSPAEYTELKRLTHERLEQREDENELNFLQQHYLSNANDKSNKSKTNKSSNISRLNSVNNNNYSSIIQQQYPQHYKYIQNRIYHLQLLQCARLQHQRHGRGPQGTDDAPSSGADSSAPLSPKEQMELRRFNEQRQQDIHDMNEYYKLKKEMMTNKNNPKMKKQQLAQLKQKFYELELYYKRRVAIKLTQKELYDVQYYTMKRIDDKCDMMEYQKILNQRMEGGGGGGGTTDSGDNNDGSGGGDNDQDDSSSSDDSDDSEENRLQLLEMMDRKKHNMELSPYEQQRLKEYHDTLHEEYDDCIEYEELLSKRESSIMNNNSNNKSKGGGGIIIPFNRNRLYELELVYKNRRQRIDSILFGDTTTTKLTKEELYDLKFYRRKRVEDKELYQDLVNQQKLWQEVDEEQLKLMELVVVKRPKQSRYNTQALTDEDYHSLKVFDTIKREELDDIKELRALRKRQRRKDAKKEAGGDGDDANGDDDFDEERLYELELYERHRDGEELLGEELKDFETFEEKRVMERPDKMELADLLDQKLLLGGKLNDADEHRLHCLTLLDKKRRGIQELTDEENVLVTTFERDRRREKREKLELQNLISRKERGEVIDEVRFYKLRVYEKKRNGEKLSKKEKHDLEKFEKDRKDKEMSSDLNSSEQERLEEERLEEERVYKQLQEQGLPNQFQFSDDDVGQQDMSSSLNASMTIFGNDSFVKDLKHQQETRAERRKEEALEDAFEIYQTTLKQLGKKEDEDLFKAIFQKVLRDKNEENAEADKAQDLLIQRESNIQSRQKWKSNPRQALRDYWVGSGGGGSGPNPPTNNG